MDQTVSTVLKANETLKLTGPGSVKIISGKTVALSKLTSAKAIKAAAVKSAVAGTTATVGLTTTLAPFIGMACLIVGLAYLTTMARDVSVGES
jgi:hypothetical protein